MREIIGGLQRAVDEECGIIWEEGRWQCLPMAKTQRAIKNMYIN